MGDAEGRAALMAAKTVAQSDSAEPKPAPGLTLNLQSGSMQQSPRHLLPKSARSPRPNSKRGRPVTGSSPRRDDGHSGNSRRADATFEACFITPRRARSLSARAEARGGIEKIVVREQDFRRCGGDLNKLRQCQVPPWQEPARRPQSWRDEFEQSCRATVEYRDPWQGLENPERTREVYESDITINQIWVDRSPEKPRTLTEELQDCKGPIKRSRSVDYDPVFEANQRETLEWLRKVSLPAARFRSAGLESKALECKSEEVVDPGCGASDAKASARQPSQRSRATSKQMLKPPLPDSSVGRAASSSESTPRAPSPTAVAPSLTGEVAGRNTSRDVKGYRTERPPRAPGLAGSTPAATAGATTTPLPRAPSRGAAERLNSTGPSTPRGPLPPLCKREESRRSSSRGATSVQAVADKPQDSAAGTRRASSGDRSRPVSGRATSRESKRASLDTLRDRLKTELEDLSGHARQSRRRHS